MILFARGMTGFPSISSCFSVASGAESSFLDIDDGVMAEESLTNSFAELEVEVLSTRD